MKIDGAFIYFIVVLCASYPPLRAMSEALSPLHKMARDNKISELAGVIQNCKDIDAKSEEGFTALHYAVIAGHQEAASLLLAAGANVDSEDAQGNTALHIASLKGNHVLCVFLLANNASRWITNHQKHKPIDIALARLDHDLYVMLAVDESSIEQIIARQRDRKDSSIAKDKVSLLKAANLITNASGLARPFISKRVIQERMRK